MADAVGKVVENPGLFANSVVKGYKNITKKAFNTIKAKLAQYGIDDDLFNLINSISKSEKFE